MRFKSIVFFTLSFLALLTFIYFLLSNDLGNNKKLLGDNLKNLSGNMMFLKNNKFLKSSLEFHSSGSVKTMLEDYLNAHENGPEAAFVLPHDSQKIFSFASINDRVTLSTVSMSLKEDKIRFDPSIEGDTSNLSSKKKIYVYSKIRLSNDQVYFIVAVIDKKTFLDRSAVIKDINFDKSTFTISPDYIMLIANNYQLLMPLICLTFFLLILVYDMAKAYRILKDVLKSLSFGKIVTGFNYKSIIFNQILKDVKNVCVTFKMKNDELKKSAIEKQETLSKINGIVESAQTIAHDTCEVHSIFKGVMDESFEVIRSIKKHLYDLKLELPQNVSDDIEYLHSEYKMADQYGKYAYQLINDLKNLDKIDQLNLSKANVSDVISTLIDKMKVLIPDHVNFAVEFRHTKEVELDKSMVSRIIYNLLKNCIEACDYGSKVWIKTIDSNNGIDIIVGNTDSYITCEQMDNLKSKNRSYRPQGTGLGLYIADKLLNLHNSTFDIRSCKRKLETEFIVHLKEYVYA